MARMWGLLLCPTGTGIAKGAQNDKYVSQMACEGKSADGSGGFNPGRRVRSVSQCGMAVLLLACTCVP